jgi:hypothetical protein
MMMDRVLASYNLKNDIGEITNFAENFPKKLKELSTHTRSLIEDKNAS